MLRSIGIPARWALGYAQGETLPNNSKLIRQRDAHSWPEVYFPGIGWVEFEPTAAQPNISRVFGQSGTDENSLTPNENALAEEEKALREMQEELRRAREARLIAQAQDEAQNDWLKYLFWGIPILLAGSLVYLIWRRRDRIDTNNIPIYIESTLLRYGIRPPGFITNWSRRVSLPPMAKAYQEINNALNRLDKPPAVHTTPTERSTSLTQAIPSTKPHADQLVREYLRATYSQQTGDIVLARYASTEIRRISYRLYIRTFTRRLFSRLQRKPPTRV